MPNIDMTEVIKIANKDEFWEVRGKAIQAYANLEQALATLFSVLAGTTNEVAGIILFRISSADSRNKILQRLFRKKFGDRFNLFRNSVFDQLRPIDLERNEIVHWNAACRMGHDGTKETAEVLLVPPTFLSTRETPMKTTQELRAFIAKCNFYSRLLQMFSVMEGDIRSVSIPEADKLPWRDIFAQPVAYPPPEDHPLFPKPQALESHIQAFLV